MKFTRFLITSCLLVFVSLALNSNTIIDEEANAPPPPNYFEIHVKVENVPTVAYDAEVTVYADGLAFSPTYLAYNPFGSNVYVFRGLSLSYTGTIYARVNYYTSPNQVGCKEGISSLSGTFIYNNDYKTTISSYVDCDEI
jgi:hypothetical protein